MKPDMHLKAGLLVLLLAAFLDSVAAQAQYTTTASTSNGPITALRFDNATQTAIWVMKDGAAQYTHAFTNTGTWGISHSIVFLDGKIAHVWADATGQIGYWLYSATGTPLAATTFGASGWTVFPWAYGLSGNVETGAGACGDSRGVIGFFNAGLPPTTTAAWIMGSNGAIVAVLSWPITPGTAPWLLWAINSDDANKKLRLEFDNPTGRVFATYTYNNSGAWIGANTYTY